MRKKQLNLYKPVKNLGPPYLTPDQISQFNSQFTLFDKQLSLKKINEAMGAQTHSKVDKLVSPFMLQFKNKENIGFDEYIGEMLNYFAKQNVEETIVELLGDQNGEIGKDVVKDVLQDCLGRDIPMSQLKGIMDELMKQENGLPFMKKKENNVN